MIRKRALIVGLLVPVLCLLSAIIYAAPGFQERVGWRIDQVRADLKYAFNPPEEAVFVPQEQAGAGVIIGEIVNATVEAFSATLTAGAPTPTPVDTATPTPEMTATPAPSPTPTLSPTPLPTKVLLSGITHEYQMWNNCGPANLAMALSLWGWSGDQRDTAAYLKPNPRDKNVMSYEMVDYVQEMTDFSALARVGGNLATIKALVAAGYPVIVEKGFEGPNFDGWMGHYEVVYGYEDERQLLTVMDSYNGPDIKIPYEDLVSEWRAFNFTYILVYPPEREAEVLQILGPQADPAANYQAAAERALQETQSLSGRDLFFAWFNRGSNLVNLHDYAAAATAFDAAFANYGSIPKEERPWRMLWYQTGPYFAYYFGQRYNDVVNLADTTLQAASEPVLEESYYWRGRAKVQLGDVEGAIEDYRLSLEQHPDFSPALQELEALGAQP